MKIISYSEQEAWENALTQVGGPASFFQSWNWGEFESRENVEVVRLGFEEDPEELLAVAQMFVIRAKRGHYLHVRNGPVFKSDLVKEKIAAVMAALKAYALEHKFQFLRISPLLTNTPEHVSLFRSLGMVPSQMHDVDAEVTWMLDLNQPMEELLKGMRDSHRYLIRKSLKMADLEIVKTTDPEMVKEFWPIYEETFKRQHWTAYRLEYLKEEFATFAKDDQVMLFLAKYQGKFIAASMFIYYRGEVFYHHSGSLTEYRNVPAMYRIHYESILEAINRGMQKYNFFGIARTDDKSHPWAGLTLFKKGFGGRQQEWMHAMDLPLKMQYWFTHYYELLERKKRGY